MIVRQSLPADALAMAEVLNAIIAIGGTTAHERPKTAVQVCADYVNGPAVLASVVAEDQGRVIGWQSVGMWQGDPHIGTFVQPGVQARGVGAALFAATCAQLRARGTLYIIAHIRADNVPGLAYYARIGFRDIGGDPDFALSDGRRVGRIHRRFDL
jgi:L-amino acid N-acyltransferase YncA